MSPAHYVKFRVLNQHTTYIQSTRYVIGSLPKFPPMQATLARDTLSVKDMDKLSGNHAFGAIPADEHRAKKRDAQKGANKVNH